MTETATPEALVARLRAALDEEEASAKAASRWGVEWEFRNEPYEEWPGMIGIKGGTVRVGCTDPEEGGHIARQDPARTLQCVRAHRDLAAAILSEPHHDWRGVSACRKAAYAEEECNCGRDARVGLLLEIIAGIYEEPQS